MVSGFTYVWCQTQVELARLRAPERVEQVALRQLGLKHPSKDQVVVLP
jgi:cell division protein FtsL